MVYKVQTTPEISDTIDSLPSRLDWNLCVGRIADYPFTKRADHFEITHEVSISGEDLYVFSADWVDYQIVHVARVYEPQEFILNEGYEGEAIIFNIRGLP